MQPAPQQRLIKAALALCLLLFCVSLLARLGRPLLWNDEGMTVMHAQRVREFGYPKAWDGRNMVYDLMHPNKELGLEPRTGAFIGGSGWGHYYFLAPFMGMAEGITDLHARTAFLRMLFALVGLGGLLLMGRMLWRSLHGLPERRGALLAFGLLCLLSVPLVLHLREVRYYSLLVALTAALAGLVVRHRILRPMRLLPYTVLVWLLLAALLITFSPAFFVFVLAMGAYELGVVATAALHVQEGKVLLHAKALLPALGKAIRHNLAVPLSLVYLVPFLRFFHTFEINRELLAFNVQVQPYALYLDNLATTFAFMARFETGWLWLGLKLALLLSLRQLLADDRHRKPLAVSCFLALLTLAYLVLCSRVPNFPFTRYFLPAIPLAAAGIAVDAVMLWRMARDRWPAKLKTARWAFLLGAVLLLAPSLPRRVPLLAGHVQEIAVPYQGHLDVILPWIKERYPSPDKLVIAANYEETSFMYYLDARVIVGYVRNNALREVGVVPDIIYFNSLWTPQENERQMGQYRRMASYEEVTFPIRLYRVNNVPEVNYQEEITHQFQTLLPRWEGDSVSIWVRKR